MVDRAARTIPGRARRGGGALALLALSVALTAPAAAAGFDWRAFGEIEKGRLLAGRPTVSQVELARHVASRVSHELARQGVPVGDNLATQMAHPADPTIGQCGFVADALEGAMLGAGFDPRQVFKVEGRAERNLNPFWVASDHGAVALAVGGKVLLFDPWMKATGSGRTWPMSTGDRWNGMPLGSWVTAIADYSSFTWYRTGLPTGEGEANRRFRLEEIEAFQEEILRKAGEAGAGREAVEGRPAGPWNGDLTYVPQAFGTCWAADAVALVRAYGGKATVPDLLHELRGRVSRESSGDGLWGLPATDENYAALAAAMNARASAGRFLAEPYDGTGRLGFPGLMERVLPHLDRPVPVLLATAGHALLLLRDVSGKRALFEMHDPRGAFGSGAGSGDERSMYGQRSYEWLELRNRAKNPRRCPDCAQIVVPTAPVPAEPTLQSLPVPTQAVFGSGDANRQRHGFLLFGSKRERGEKAFLTWNPDADAGLEWRLVREGERGLGRVADRIPAALNQLRASLRVWNADRRGAVSATVRLEVESVGRTVPPLEERLSLPAAGEMAESGPAVVAFSADDLCPLRTDSPHPVTVTARLEVGGREVDGFTAKAQLEARPRILSTSPLSAPEGAVVTLRGQRFGDEPSPSNRLLFNGREWSVSSWKDHEIVAVVRSDAPPGPRPRVGNLVARPEGGCPSAFFTFAIEPDEEAPPPTAPPPGGRKGGRWVVEKTWFVKPKLAGEVVLWDDGRAKPVRFRGGLAGERSLTADWTYTPKGWPTQHCHGELTFSLGGDLDTLVAGEERDVSLKVTTTGDASCHYFGSLAWDKELSLGTPVTGPGKTEKSPPKRFRIPEPRGEARDARAVLHWVLGGGNEENFVEMLRQYRWVP